MRKIFTTQLLAFISIIALAITGAGAFAQTHHGGGNMGVQHDTVVGTVSMVNGTTVELLNGLFSIDASQAKILSPGSHDPLTVASIMPGMHITAMVTTTDANTLQATTIVLPPIPNNNIVMLRGALQSVDVAGGSLMLLNHKIIVNANTKFPRNLHGLGDLKANENIFVTAEASGTDLVAVAIGFGPSAAHVRMHADGENQSNSGFMRQPDDEK